MDQLDIAIHQTAHDAPGGMAALARAMGKGHQVLINKCNPNNENNVLSVREAIAMMEHTGDLRILEVIAQTLGCKVVRGEARTPKSISDALLAAYVEEGDVSRVIQDSLADGKLTAHEKADIAKEIAKAKDALDELNAAIQASPTILSAR